MNKKLIYTALQILIKAIYFGPDRLNGIDLRKLENINDDITNEIKKLEREAKQDENILRRV